MKLERRYGDGWKGEFVCLRGSVEKVRHVAFTWVSDLLHDLGIGSESIDRTTEAVPAQRTHLMPRW